MRALEEQVTKGLRFAQTTAISAPVKGWNTIDPLAVMDPQYAVQLDNWIPQPGYVEKRGGSQAWVTALPSPPSSLIPFVSGLESKLFAAAGGQFYDVTMQGFASPGVYSIASPDNWIYQAFETLAGPYTVACNGVDPVLLFNGTSWSPSAIIDVDPTTLCGVAAYQARLWFVQKNTLSAWYLAPGTISGSAVQFNLGPQFKRGGSLVAVGAWSLDAGNGPSEYIIFVSNQGEIVVYQGTDPSQPSTFSKIGTYRVPNPIGFKCLLQYGGDVLVLTQQGVYPLSKALLSSTIDRSSAVSYTISSQFAADFANSFGQLGWDMTLFTPANLLVVNIPNGDPNGGNAQYVMNTLTGAWCRFTALDATCWCEFEGKLFFGGVIQQQAELTPSGLDLLDVDGAGTVLQAYAQQYVVYQAQFGTSDNGAPITTSLLTAYSYFEQPLSQKQIKLVRPTIQTSDNLDLFLAISTDFTPLQPSDYADIDFNVATVSNGGIWDLSLWDQALWQANLFNPLQWCSPYSRTGFCMAIGLETMDASSVVRLSSFDVAYELGQGIL